MGEKKFLNTLIQKCTKEQAELYTLFTWIESKLYKMNITEFTSKVDHRRDGDFCKKKQKNVRLYMTRGKKKMQNEIL